MLTECCDVIVAHSPPMYSGTPQVLYQNFRLVVNKKQQSPLSVRRYNSRSSNSPTRGPDDRQPQANHTPGFGKPRRPCLVIRADSEGSMGGSSSSGGSSSDENEPASPVRRKKKVVFADDRGLSLTQVRLMNEPSNQPPKLMTVSPYLNQLQSASSSSSSSHQSDAGSCSGTAAAATKHLQHLQQTGADQIVQQWYLRFSQPASSYVDFRKRLDTDNISLENVIVRSPDRRIVGTVKVRNLSYDKAVFVRCTHDRWAGHVDTPCTYVQNNAMVNAAAAGGSSCSAQPPPPNVAAIYDTFSFQLSLPVHAASMEFAVCYKSAEFECWDNNDGVNYCLSSVAKGPSGGVALPQQLLQLQSPVLVADFDHHLHHPKQPVHYFGAQSTQNSWSTWRDQKNDTSAYW